jgi:hypothetical protein
VDRLCCRARAVDLFVVGLAPLILVGHVRGWAWIRNKVLRRIHLGMMGFVLVEALLGIACPLTVWEEALRRGSGAESYDEGFLAYWISRILFFDMDPALFTIIYAAFFALLVFLYRKIPPRLG